MFRIATVAGFAVMLMTTPVIAQSSDAAKLDALFDALAMSEIVDIMREEGLVYGASIADDMLPGGPSQAWMDAVELIYDPQMMLEDVRGAFDEALEGDDLDAMLAFYTSQPGTTIIDLEVSARRAMLDEEIARVSTEAAALEILDETPRYQMVRDFIAVNDLIEGNVVGSLNASYAFYVGLIDGGVMPGGITPETALQDVWSQEEDIRDSTTEWLYSFLLLAYQPLSDEDLSTYIAFSQTDAGQDLTGALFASFNDMFNDISGALGLATSRFLVSQEL